MVSKLFNFMVIAIFLASLTVFAEGTPILEKIDETHIRGLFIKGGCFIDTQGDVYLWQSAPLDTPRRRINQISEEQYQEIQDLLRQAKQGEISEARQEMLDVGITRYQGHIYDTLIPGSRTPAPESKTTVFLGIRGDVVVKNSALAAPLLIALLDWACEKKQTR